MQARERCRMTVGELVGELVSCRVRYFTDGAVTGSWEFVVEQQDGPQDEGKKTKLRCVKSIPSSKRVPRSSACENSS